jgi:hypothetical protein
MSQRLSTLEECQCKMHTSMGFETPEQVVYHLFLLRLWKTHGLGTAMPKEMKMMTMMRSKKNPSEDFSSLLFLALDAKGGEEDLSIYLDIFLLSQIVI